MDSTCQVIMEKWVVPLRSPILVWMPMILRHRPMLRDQDILFQENLDLLVREKLLHALASIASQACLSACFALSWPLTLKRKKTSTYSDFWKDSKPMPFTGPCGFVFKNIVYAYFLVFEKEKSSAFFHCLSRLRLLFRSTLRLKE